MLKTPVRRFLFVPFLLGLVFPAIAHAYEGGRFAEPASQPAPRQPVLTKAPTVKLFVPAEYPESQKGQGTVEVVLMLYLNADGEVSKAVPGAHGVAQAFVDAAIAAGSKLRFTPAEVDDKASAIGLEFKYVFTEDLSHAPVASSAPVPEKNGNAVLKGEIREAGTRLRQAGVALHLKIGKLELEQTSDDKGHFEFRDLPPGEATLTVVSQKHRKRVLSYKVEAKVELSERNIYLQREVLDPYETIVQGKREQREITKRVISREELTKVPGSFGDPLRAIQNFPSVARPNLLGGALVIRGAAPNSSQFFVDGMKMPALYHFAQGPSVIQESFIEDITFMPCCFSVRYGRATAGIIDVSLRKPDLRKFSGKVAIDVTGVRAFVEVPITDNTIVQLGGRRSYIDAVIGPVLNLVNPPMPGQVANPLLLPVYYDYQGRIIHKTKTAGEFALFVFGSDDRLKFSQTPSQQTSAFNPAKLNVALTNHAVQPSWQLKITPKLVSTLTLQGGYALNSASTPDLNFQQGSWTLGWREEMRWKASDQFNLIVGTTGDLGWNYLKTSLPLAQRYPVFPSPGTANPPFTDFDSKIFIAEFSAYAEGDIRFAQLRILPGLRIEEIGYQGRARSAVTPRLSARYKILPTIELKAGVGLFARRPDAQNLIADFGNPDLELQYALHSTVGMELSLTQALSLETSVFANYLWDEAAGTSRVQIKNNNIVPLVFDNRQVGRVYGAELLLRHKPYKNFFGWVAYTISRAERRTDDDWFLFNFDQTHILVIVGSYILPYGFQVGLRFRLVSGNPTTPVTGSVYDADSGGYNRVNAAFRSARLPAFHQLDIRIDKQFDLPWFSISVYLDIQNVYNHENAEFSQFSFDYSKQQYFSGVPFLPILGLEAKW